EGGRRGFEAEPLGREAAMPGKIDDDDPVAVPQPLDLRPPDAADDRAVDEDEGRRAGGTMDAPRPARGSRQPGSTWRHGTRMVGVAPRVRLSLPSCGPAARGRGGSR